MDDEWELPVPREDPEARKAPAAGGGGGGCPMGGGRNFVEGELAGNDGAEFGRPDPAPTRD